MSNIPSTAVIAAFVPVQRATNELIRARKVQSQKETHHHEDVEELEDTAVNSVTDEQQDKGNQRQGKFRKRQEEEKVEIESLQLTPGRAKQAAEQNSHLDISA